MRAIGTWMLGFSLVAAGMAGAAIPWTLNYQGLLTDASGVPLDGEYTLTFRLYEAPSGGTALWQETDTTVVTSGVFSAVLGKSSPLDLPFDVTYWLGISVGDESELTPRAELTASPYALRAAVADSVAGGGGGIGGSGTNNQIVRFTGPTTIGNSIVCDTGTSVGIGPGFTSPNCLLHIHSDEPVIRLTTPASGSAWNDGLQIGPQTSNAITYDVWNREEGSLRLGTSNTERIRILPDGKVGIGLSQPEQMLHVAGTVQMNTFKMPSGAGAGRVLTSDGSGVGTWQTATGGIGGSGTQNYLPIFTTATTLGNSMLYQIAPGHLGIGTTSPSSARVTIGGASDVLDAVLHLKAVWNPEIALDCGGTAADAKIRFTTDGIDNTKWMIRYDGSEDRLKLEKVWQGTVMTLDYGTVPRVGIGTIAPTTQLEVKNTSGFDAIRAECTGSNSFNYRAVTGRSVHASAYGYGGDFEGGRRGVYGHVSPGNHHLPTYGGYGQVAGQSGYTGASYGLYGETYGPATNSYGVYGYAHSTGQTNYGVLGRADSGASNYAGYFQGNVHVNGTLSKSAGSFKIDHPLDPENRYLSHSFVESPDMMNVYNGNVVLDNSGEAWVSMPDYFEALNEDYRYQLTAIGGPGPNLHLAEEIRGNRFKIAGGTGGLRVSWQVTGIRRDPWAEAYRIQVEEWKGPDAQGRYLNPEVHGAPASMSIHATPEE